LAVYDLGRMLGVLCEERVDFILVGGIAAVLQGAPVLTQDVDILYQIEEQIPRTSRCSPCSRQPSAKNWRASRKARARSGRRVNAHCVAANNQEPRQRLVRRTTLRRLRRC